MASVDMERLRSPVQKPARAPRAPASLFSQRSIPRPRAQTEVKLTI